MLSDLESDSSGESSLHHLSINEHYAAAFQYKKEREELAKLKEKYGSDIEDSNVESETDSEEDVTEDEDGEELTPAMDAAILRTLAKIKRKDPEIYNIQKPVFEDEKERTGNITNLSRHAGTKDKSKPLTVRQAALASVLDTGSRSPSPAPITHVEEQRALRDETIAAFHHAVQGREDEDDGLLIPREKTKDELEREEEQYRAFLEKEIGPELDGLITVDKNDLRVDGEDEVHGKGKGKAKKKGNGQESKKKSKEESDQEFLVNYILNRGWIDRSARRIPTYGEITSTSKSKKKGANGKRNPDEADGASGSRSSSDAEPDAGAHENIDLDEDNEFEEVNELFETSYNFRFEEPNAAQVKTYPRNLPSIVRRTDTTRKEARERRKQRKEDELLKKHEEVKRLKALKMKELQQKLERIGREGGKDLEQDEALQELDLEGDWDPEDHDRQMAKLYSADADGGDDEEMPQWDDDIDIGDLIPAESNKKSKKKKKKKEADIVDEVAVDVDAMDAGAVQVNADDEEWDGTEEMRKRKLDEYMDELYGLEFNDMVGDMPTRFHYAKVEPQTFALTPADILMATDSELNQYLSVKKYAPYRRGALKWDNTRNERLKELKTKVKERANGFSDADALASGQPTKTKRKGKKERMKMRTDVADLEEIGSPAKTQEVSDNTEKKRKLPIADENSDHTEAIATEGTEKKKRKRRHKKAAIEGVS